MKTVLPFKERNDRQEKALFYHSKEICITQETRPVPKHWNASHTVNGVETPTTEMAFFVLRFPKEWRNRIESGAFNISPVKVWNKLDDEWELLLPTYAYTSSVFEALANSGFFRYTDKLSPLPDEGLYLPFYESPVRFWQKLSNVIGITMSIPKVSWMAYQERKEKRAGGVDL